MNFKLFWFFQMVQSTIVFENLIKSEYLRNGWWHWSSLSAAAKISNISSLALRIYTLDAAIVYDGPLPGYGYTEIENMGGKLITHRNPTGNPNSNSKTIQSTPNSDSTDRPKPRSKSSRKKKDSGS